MRLSAPSTPMTGTMAKSIVGLTAKEFLGSLMLNVFVNKGNLHSTILKLIPSIKGTYTLHFLRLHVAITAFTLASMGKGLYRRMVRAFIVFKICKSFF